MAKETNKMQGIIKKSLENTLLALYKTMMCPSVLYCLVFLSVPEERYNKNQTQVNRMINKIGNKVSDKTHRHVWKDTSTGA